MSDADFPALMEPVARQLMGDPNAAQSDAKTLRWGAKGSLAVDLEKGVWHSHEAGAGGGVLDLIVFQGEAKDRPGAAAWLKSKGFLPETDSSHSYRAKGGARQPQQAAKKAVVPPTKAEPARKPPNKVADVWGDSVPATHEHGYITRKGGRPDGLRVYPESAVPISIRGHDVHGWLVVPARDLDGTLKTVQFIPPTAGSPKLNLPGHRFDGGFFIVGNMKPGAITFVCEGIGAAWSCWKATGNPALVCFGAGNVGTVARAIRKRDSTARLVLVPDVGKEASAAEIAREVGAAVAYMPKGEVQNFDANDLAQREGDDVLAELLDAAKPPPLPLGVVFADELAASYEPPDELVQGILTAGAGSMLYGDSNSGKTFFTIDMAAAVARGVPWMGRKTEPGLVVYVAAESPASVRSRLQAYQMHHKCKVPNFAIVQTPLDLFSADTDTEALIALVKLVERQRGQKARLIVGDTLARLSAGANENSGEDRYTTL